MRLCLIALLVSSSVHADNPCVKGGRRADNASLTTTSASFCFDGAACYAAELATGRLTTGPAAGTDLPLLAEGPDSPKLSDDGGGITVCHRDRSCHNLVPTGQIDPGIGFVSAVNSTGTLAAIGVQGSDLQVEVFDVATGKHVSTFKLPPSRWMCLVVAFAGDTLDISNVECGATTGKEWLATKLGKRIAAIGGASPIMTGSPPVHVTDNTWAFTPDGGDVVILQDVVTGKVVKRISVGKADPDSPATLVGDSTHIVLIYGGTRAGDLAVIDVATGKVTQFPAKRC